MNPSGPITVSPSECRVCNAPRFRSLRKILTAATLGAGRVEGSVNRAGAVAVRVLVSVGASKASGGGRLVGNAGSGSWSGIISGDRCSGTRQATRS